MRKIQQLERGVKSVKINRVDTPRPEVTTMSTGVDINTYQVPGIDAIKLEAIFNAGRVHEEKKLASLACGSLLTEGTRHFTSEEISEKVDYEGAYLSSGASADFISLKLISSKGKFLDLLNLFEDILLHPHFSNEELNVFVQRRKQKLAMDLSKNDVVAYRMLTETLYGKDSPYGYNTTSEFLDALTAEELNNHFARYCTLGNAHLFLSGDYDRQHIEKVEALSEKAGRIKNTGAQYRPEEGEIKEIRIKGRENQTSLKMGMRLFSRQNEDYPGLYFLNTVLGGYFGSRLMKNIREEKGYTYNIYSMLDTYKHDGNWIIASEMDATNVDHTVEEIGKELKKLRERKMSFTEIDMVKNYLIGNFISTINGPFRALNPYKTAMTMELGKDYYDHLFKKVQSITGDEVMELANRYLDVDNFWKVIVGKG